MQNLRASVAVVTAGARRLGRAIALALAEAGCNVVITYRSSAADADATLVSLRASGVKALAVQADECRHGHRRPGGIGRGSRPPAPSPGHHDEKHDRADGQGNEPALEEFQGARQQETAIDGGQAAP